MIWNVHVNPSHLMISVHILHTLVRTFSWVLTRRICLLVHKNSKKELGQRPAILTSCLVNNACYISSRQVMRVKKKNINQGNISWSNTKFTKVTSSELYGRQWRELLTSVNEWLSIITVRRNEMLITLWV